MKKAVLSNRIYLEASAELQAGIDKELTYSIPAFSDTDPPLVIRNMQILRPGLLSLPIGRTDLIPSDYEIKDKRVLAPVEFPKFKFNLRASQQAVYDQIDDNSIINAQPSWGKTFSGLSIAGKLGQKTLVVTHTVPLRNQWVKETEKVYGFTPGIIGSGKFDISKPITVGNTQTLFKNIVQIQREFGTIIIDEMHHTSSPTFSKIIDTSFARYKIGLSGTIQRKDGKHVIFRDYFGNKVFQPPPENFMTPEVDIIKLPIQLPGNSATPWAVRINGLLTSDEYIRSVALIAAKYAGEGHNVLLVADRVDFLKQVTGLIGPTAIAITGEIKEERDALIAKVGKEYKVLGGTQSIFSEGISHNPLSCLILGTPVNNEPLLEQLIGRVIRELPGKQTPKIVDLNLLGYTAQNQANARLGHYIRKEYKIRRIDATA